MSKKGAVKTGGTAGRQRAKNTAMASMMREQGIVRKTCRDPITNKIVARPDVSRGINT